MNAYQFIEQNGLKKAQEVLSCAPKWATDINSDFEYGKADCSYRGGFMRYQSASGEWDVIPQNQKDPVDLKELKQAVADHELFNEAKLKMFGSFVADQYVFNFFSQLNEDLFSEKGLLLKQAIERIEGARS